MCTRHTALSIWVFRLNESKKGVWISTDFGSQPSAILFHFCLMQTCKLRHFFQHHLLNYSLPFIHDVRAIYFTNRWNHISIECVNLPPEPDISVSHNAPAHTRLVKYRFFAPTLITFMYIGLHFMIKLSNIAYFNTVLLLAFTHLLSLRKNESYLKLYAGGKKLIPKVNAVLFV